MTPISPVPAVIALIAAWLTCLAITRIYGPPTEGGRFASIDGLRGYLALFVFLSHGCLWYFYLRDGRWVEPPSHLYRHMGESSVMLFFMITGFLFFSKLMDGRFKGIDWARLFVSRVVRLGPLYLFAMLLMFVIVAFLTDFTVREPLPLLAKHAVEWLAFTVVGGPDLNGVAGTPVITAGVTWSLQYEWAFYCALPIVALCVGMVPPLRYVVLGLVAGVAFAYLSPNVFKILGFMGGILASHVSRWPPVRQWSSGITASLVVIGSIIGAVAMYPSAYQVWPLAFLSLAFCLIAAGNDLFGLFVDPISRTLGQMAYSIYLLHGILLFFVFHFVVGLDASRSLSPISHWGLIVGITPVLVATCYATFRMIEHPAMHSTDLILRLCRLRGHEQPRAIHGSVKRFQPATSKKI